MLAPYELGPIRPPSEAQSLLIRVTRNCPWNKCEFCPVYKGRKFSRRSVDEVKRDIDAAAEYHGDAFQAAFLQDADAINVNTGELEEIIRHLKKRFPSVKRITTYGRALSAGRKSVEELARLKEAGLTRLHMGLESGSQKILDYICKGPKVKRIIEAGQKVKQSGISLSEYVILGLGGKDMWREHALETARVLNAIDPDFIRVRTLRIVEGTPLWDKLASGEFGRMTDEEIAVEERLLIENLEGIKSYFASDHSLNLLMEIEGQLPDEKETMLAVIERYLSLPVREKRLFELGRRMNVFWCLEDIEKRKKRRAIVEKEIEAIESESGASVEDVTFQLMGRMI